MPGLIQTTAPATTVKVPSGKVAPLRTISLQKLEAGSITEQISLLQTCIEDGFFYLDLTHSDHAPLLKSVEDTFELSKNLFDYPSAIKELFDVDQISHLKLNGYKPKGRNVVAKSGKGDGFESWALPRNGIMQLSNDAFPHPPAISNGLDPLQTLLGGLSGAAHTIMDSLSTSLLIPKGQRFEDFQRLNRPSPDLLRLLKYHPEPNPIGVPQVPHTDMGSLTFVFSDTPGLQVLPMDINQKLGAYDESDWLYVIPKAGHAVVNVGDTLTMMSNGLLKSALHRVGPVAGCAMPERYSMAFLMRPENHALLKGSDSPLLPRTTSEASQDAITSGEWIEKKFMALRGHKSIRGHKDQGNFDQILTGGRGVLV